MKRQLLLRPWIHCYPSPSSDPISSPFHLSFQTQSLRSRTKHVFAVVSGGFDGDQQATGRERRRARNEKRAIKSINSNSWREEVEEKLAKKPKKRYASWKEELNINKLALLGPQWWIVRVSRSSAPETARFLARSLTLRFPEIQFELYTPTVQVRNKLKNGSYSVKQKPLFPGCVFFKCVLDRDIHDFVKEYAGVGGFVGARVGNEKRQINKPRPVSVEDMKAIFRQEKELQDKSELALKNEHFGERTIVNPEKMNTASHTVSSDDTEYPINSKPRRRSRKASEGPPGNWSSDKNVKPLVRGSSVRVLSGNLAEFVGKLMKVDRKNGKARVQFMLFGKVTIADLDVNEIVAETL